MKKNKQKALELLKKKISGEITITFKEISNQTGYERKQINRFYNQIKKRILKICSSTDSHVRILIIQLPTKKLNI